MIAPRQVAMRKKFFAASLGVKVIYPVVARPCCVLFKKKLRNCGSLFSSKHCSHVLVAVLRRRSQVPACSLSALRWLWCLIACAILLSSAFCLAHFWEFTGSASYSNISWEIYLFPDFMTNIIIQKLKINLFFFFFLRNILLLFDIQFSSP